MDFQLLPLNYNKDVVSTSSNFTAELVGCSFIKSTYLKQLMNVQQYDLSLYHFFVYMIHKTTLR